MPFPASPAANQRHTEAGRTWIWSGGVWRPFLGYSVNAAGLPIGTIGNLTATNTQQALQQLFERAITEGPSQPTGRLPQGTATQPITAFTNPGILHLAQGGPWRRYAYTNDSPVLINQTTTPMPPGWASGQNGPALMTDSTARMVTADAGGDSRWNNVAVQGSQTPWGQSSTSMTAGQVTMGVWALPRPGGQKRWADIWIWGVNDHNIQFLWDTVDGSIPTTFQNPNLQPSLMPNGSEWAANGNLTTTVHDFGVYRMPSGWTFGWMQLNTNWQIQGFSLCMADRVTNGTPGMQYWPGSPATSGLYWWRWFTARGYVSVPNILG